MDIIIKTMQDKELDIPYITSRIKDRDCLLGGGVLGNTNCTGIDCDDCILLGINFRTLKEQQEK